MSARPGATRHRWWPAALFAAGAVAGCGATPNILPSNDFARPTDIAFMCFGAFPQDGTGGDDGGTPGDDGGSSAPVQITGRPMRQCHPPGPASQTDVNGNPVPDPGAKLTSRTFAFVVNSANGELTVVDADNWKLVDLDRESAGYDSALLGGLPQQISVTNDGCRLVSANRGSGDLTLVDPSVLIAPTFESDFPSSTFPPTPSPDSGIQRGIVPHGADGTPVGAPPFEAVFLPKNTSGMDAANRPFCPPMDGSAPQSWPALVSFPTCDLIALVDLPSGVVLDSVFVHNGTDAPVSGGASPHCPAAAGGGMDGGTAADGGASSVAVDTGTARPWSIQVTPDGTRAFVSLSSAPGVVSLGLAGSSISIFKTIPLNENAGGSDRIRLAVDPYHYKAAFDYPGVFVGQNVLRNYLYVIAHDGTLRVIDVTQSIECETNYDPLSQGDMSGNGCIPVNPAVRRPFITGPGIRLPTGIPVDIAAADIRGDLQTNITSDQDNVSGAFAWVLSSSGFVYLVNIDPDPRHYPIVTFLGVDPNTGVGSYGLPPQYLPPNPPPPEPPPYPNTLRDRNQVAFSPGMDPSSGPPRLDDPPTVPTGEPFIETFYARASADNWTAVDPTGAIPLATQVYFPDRNAVTPQTWTVNWQGTLVAPRFSGHIDNKASTLQDGVGFCEANVLPGDLVTLDGCSIDADCGSGTVCVHSDTAPEQAAGGIAVRGLCMDPNHASERKDDAFCGLLLRTARRYEIVQAGESLLTLRPHRDELVRSALMPCRVPADAGGAVPDGGTADGGAVDVSDDCHDPNDSTTGVFVCTADPLSNGTPRCLNTCKTPGDTTECRQGHVCVDFSPDRMNPQPGMQFCADAPPLDLVNTPPGQAAYRPFDRCFDQLARYQVDVGNGFLVAGSSTGILPQVVNRQPTDPQSQATCGLDPNSMRNPRLVSRIPIGTSSVPGAPDPTPLTCKNLPVDAATFQTLPLPDTEPNDRARLALLTQQTPPDPDPCFFVGGPSSDSPTGNHVRAVFQNTELRFVMGDVERAPSTPVPIRFDVHGGYHPQTVIEPVTVQVSMPARIVLTPVDSQPQNTTPASSVEAPYLMVVDQRRLGNGQGGGPTRGQLLRINPFGYAATYGYQPLFEDYQHSNSLFPIQ